ncbi:MAG: toprim domain-containing protein [Endomicrobium sp.]|jgi:hypothetical protein|nr:toprim domain-containing protein [Endomicrobium sp.]
MSNIFAELQMQINVENNSMQDARKQMNEIVRIFKLQNNYMEQLSYFAELRKGISVNTLIMADAFMVDLDYPVIILPEELRHDSLGMCRGNSFVYAGRFVYPVKDVRGDVAGWCGYDKFEDIKYLDSKNYGYKAKYSMLYGMEYMKNYYSNTAPIFITEGIVCALWLRQNGFNALALCGSYLSTYVIAILRRFGKRCIVVPDSDDAGNKLAEMSKRYLKDARVIQSRIAKDIDDSQKVHKNLVQELLLYTTPFRSSKYFKDV